MWVEFSDQTIGKGYKYRDYLVNFGIIDAKPQEFGKADGVNSINSALIRQILSNYRRPGIEQIKKDLVAAVPPV
jgi:hypothetical protein